MARKRFAAWLCVSLMLLGAGCGSPPGKSPVYLETSDIKWGPPKAPHVPSGVKLPGDLRVGLNDDPSVDYASNVNWSFQPEGVKLRLQADPNLNLYQNTAHTLALCVYQLTTPDTFNDLAGTEAGIQRLLQCKRFEDSAASFAMLVVQPGEGKVVLLDRAEKARYAGVVAGYYDINPTQDTRLYQIPILVEEKGWIFKDKSYRPARLLINLFLAPQELQAVEGDQ